ncbi:MAG TPA: GTPase Era [bacterium]
MSDTYRSGFVCLVGRPNVGKSTLVNRLVGQPVSIVSAKPQTTRTRILGVCSGSDWQAVLIDTPGIHQARDPLNRRLVAYATGALQDADLAVVLVEPLTTRHPEPGPEEQMVLDRVKEAGVKALLAVNKVDAAPEAAVLETLRHYGGLDLFAELFPISATNGRGVNRLVDVLPKYLSEGPRYFEDDQWTDQSVPQLLGELVRQEVFQRTDQEIPYSTAVQVQHLEVKEGVTVIHARIVVERDSQKGIVIGKGGKMLKGIGQAARRRMETLLGTRVFLDLQVEVLPDWSRDARRLEELGYPEV